MHLSLSVLSFAAHLLITALAQEAPYVRTFFYVGGSYVLDNNSEHVFANQMYVEKISPIDVNHTQPHPIVLIHGKGQTGTNWLNKPDDTTSWTTRFLQKGYTLYIVDDTVRGRSPWIPGEGAEVPTTFSAELVQRRFTAPELYDLWPQAGLHTQWPGNGTMGDPVFDAFYASNVQYIDNDTYQQSTVQAAGAALLDRIGTPAILLGHSQGCSMPLVIADARPELTAGLVLLEPIGPPFQEAVFTTVAARKWGVADIPLTYEPAVDDPETELVKHVFPPPVENTDNSTVPCILQAETPQPRSLKNLKGLPVLVVTGEASYHASYDYCTAAYLRQAGVERTEHYELGKIGIKGNGHFVFLERNSDEVWELVDRWIQKNGS
ncbi:hypothetical protein VNI00_003544 [Paramarasmius palmivorus]|uniref:AB hydrolase-1 domain-containing protein n=1 Tax=Paramarasmius palmivorus TaxID=297713 RepID=A0AAW0DSS0_9AGAR